MKRGERAGYPRFRSLSRYDSFTLPHYGNGCRLLDNGKLRLQGIGQIKVKLHRSIEGKIKTVSIKREASHWYACFSVEGETKLLSPCSEVVGLDVGLSAFATLSDGTEIKNPRYFQASQSKLRRAQRKVSRRKLGSNRRRNAAQLAVRLHTHIRNQRADFHHKVSRSLINQYGLIAVEDLNIKGLASGMLAKQVNDAGWSAFIAKLSYKVEETGRELVKVDPRGTSQRCTCGASVPKTLAQRWHSCHACGLSVGRDHASALEILRLGLSLSDVTYSATSSVSEEAAA
jgi:putative transposase